KGSGIVLRPHETALLNLESSVPAEIRRAQEFRVVLAQSGKGPVEGWAGRIETPSASTHVAQHAIEALNGKLRAPTYFPDLSRRVESFANGSGHESVFQHRIAAHFRFLNQLSVYDSKSIAQELDRRMATEEDFSMKLLLAAVAAERGSIAGRDAILSSMK